MRSDSKEQLFKGIFPYLVTPLDDNGNVKEEVLAGLVDHLIRKGVHGLTPLGSTGEGVYLEWPTKKRVIEVVLEAAAGRVPVVAGVNSITSNGAVREAVETESLGVDGVLAVLPTYFPIPDDQVVAHFRSIAGAISCPVVVYANPRFAGWDVSVAILRELAEQKNIVYVKDASGDIGKLLSLITSLGDRFKIFSATAHVPLCVFFLGGVGWMAGPACLIPEQSRALYELACQKRWEEALQIQKQLWPLNIAFQRYSLAACVKAGLEMQGFPVGDPLAPQSQLDSEGKKDVRCILGNIGAL